MYILCLHQAFGPSNSFFPLKELPFCVQLQCLIFLELMYSSVLSVG